MTAGPKTKKVGADDFIAAGHDAASLLALPIATSGKARPPSQSKTLIEFTKSAELFCSADGDTAYATVTVKGHRETWAVKSSGFRRYLARCFYAQEQKAPTSQAVQEAIGIIESNAYYGGAPRHHVHTRLAEQGGAIYLDLANDAWEAVEITATGWKVVQQAPVRFRHPKALLPLPAPVSGGSLKELRAFINVKDEVDWKLMVGWLIGAVNQVGSYPVLVVGGEHGSAKSTAGAVLRKVLDPNASLLRAEPRNKEDLIISANNGWVVNLDNMSGMQPWLSDMICRISTGGGLSKRELYTDDGETILSVKRPVIVNSIEEVVTRSDLLDRSILLSLPMIPERQRIPEREFWPRFDAAHSRLLGALLDAVSVALKRVGEVRLDRLPRMADFATWVTAAEPALGWKDGEFMTAYTGNRSEAHELALDASPVAAAVREFITRQPEGRWGGASTALLEQLNALATTTEQIRRSGGWPKASHALTGKLRVLTPNLRAVGVEVVLQGRSHKKRLLQLSTLSIEKERPDPPDRFTQQEGAKLGGGASGSAGGAPAPKAPPRNSPKEKERGAGGAQGAPNTPSADAPPAQPINPDDPANHREPPLEDML